MSRRPPLVFIFAVTLTGILNNTLVTPAIPDILRDFGVPSNRSGILVSVGSVAGILLAPAIGFLADRYGRRLVLTACLVTFAVFGLGAALAPTFELLLVARFLQGMGSAGLINLAVVLIGDHWTGAERTRLVGRNSAVLTVGLASLPLVSGVITETLGWRATFGVYTVAFVTAGWSWLILDGSRPAEIPELRRQLRDAGAAVKRPETATNVGITLIMFMMIFGLMLTVLPIHLAEVFGLDAAARGLFISVPAITSTVAAFNLGRIRRRANAATMVAAAATLWAIAFTTIGLAGSLVVVAVGALVFGAGEGSLVPLLQDVAMSSAPEGQRGAVVATWVGFARLGQTLGPLVAGFGLGAFGSGTTLVAGSALAVVMAIAGGLGPLRGASRRLSPTLG